MANEAARAAASSTARIVWGTADKFLRNVVEPQEYGDYILPFTVLRRHRVCRGAQRDAAVSDRHRGQ